ncbi:hypothetical protein FNV43_RR00478 [Rhamnella rubrinervis]|uniref:Uncharacterized protein n=1 Tax=Rhamnella rubrinervis TaxID=2594499 RepID=A0A8K0HMW5_9ROSA|nr:hypothetical protein FNV43_RR00478 [Rhamnella rubrinervis]
MGSTPCSADASRTRPLRSSQSTLREPDAPPRHFLLVQLDTTYNTPHRVPSKSNASTGLPSLPTDIVPILAAHRRYGVLSTSCEVTHPRITPTEHA